MLFRSKKRRLIAGVALFLFGLGVVYLGADFALRKSGHEIVPLAQRALQRMDVSLRDVSIQNSGLSVAGIAFWEDLRCSFEVGEESPLARRAGFDARLKRFELRPSSLLLNRFEMRLEGVSFDTVYMVYPDHSLDVKDVWIRVESFKREIEMSLKRPVDSIRGELEEWKRLARFGEIDGEIEIVAQIGFTLEGEEMALNCTHESRADGQTGLRARKEDIVRLAGHFSQVMTEAEVELVSKYPLQAPYMLYLHEYAINEAINLSNRDARVSRDAYRHLLWSYLLTKRFGPELAEEITDAHEIGSLTNTAADHRMDYRNNEIGRRYALEGRAVDEIARLVFKDPEVVQEPI